MLVWSSEHGANSSPQIPLAVGIYTSQDTNPHKKLHYRPGYYSDNATDDPLELSRVYVSVTNNNGFWIGWLDLLTPSVTISLNRNQLQELTLNLQPNPSSSTAEDSPHSRSTILYNWTTLTLMSSRHGPHTENTALLLLRVCLLGFPRDRYPASPLARWLLPVTVSARIT
jgi:hypothetical protein